MTTPFGVPVEPEVKRICAASADVLRQFTGPLGARRTSSSENAGDTCSPSAPACPASSQPTAVATRSEASASSSRRGTRAQTERSEEHTSELQSLAYLVCRLLPGK